MPEHHSRDGHDFNGAKEQFDRQRQQGNGIDADEVRQAITPRAREFVEWMFPCAVVHKSGRYAVIGDIYGQPGESLEIELTGPKAGYWNDWASDPDGGRDLLSATTLVRPTSRRPHLRAAPPTHRADEAAFDIGQPDVVRPLIRVDLDMVAAPIVGAIDQHVTNAHVAHLAEGDLGGACGHKADQAQGEHEGGLLHIVSFIAVGNTSPHCHRVCACKNGNWRDTAS